jgi:hypothetical protein
MHICMRRWDTLLTSESEKVTNEVSSAPDNAPTSLGKKYNGSLMSRAERVHVVEMVGHCRTNMTRARSARNEVTNLSSSRTNVNDTRSHGTVIVFHTLVRS